MKITVTGAGGFIGHHLVNLLKNQGHTVRGVDIRKPLYGESKADEFFVTDLRNLANANEAILGFQDRVYHLAANMGGIGFLETHKAEMVRDNTMIDLSMLEASRNLGIGRFYYTSSACVYASYKQSQTDILPLREEDAYPADPEDGYGWEKLYAERMCRHYREDFKVETRIGRFHNIYGPLGAYDGGREKSVGAFCRKLALAKDGDTIDVWGDGNQTRSFCYVEDAVWGVMSIMESECPHPINIGRDDMISVNGLIDMISGIAGKRVKRKYDVTKPKGVRGRNADLSLLKKVTGWEPTTDMPTGLQATYEWIVADLTKRGLL
jgi:GDP-D-mannose 3', 5'-epimerase